MSVRRCKREVYSDEFAEWLAFQKIEGPWGEERADLRAGITASTIANCNSTILKVLTGVRQQTFAPKHFMPTFGNRAERQSPEEMRMIWRAIVAQHNKGQARQRGKVKA